MLRLKVTCQWDNVDIKTGFVVSTRYDKIRECELGSESSSSFTFHENVKRPWNWEFFFASQPHENGM